MKTAGNISEHDLVDLKGVFVEYPFIASAYLFGSVAAGKAGPLSDVDIALLLKEDAPKGRDLIHTEDYLAYRLAKALGVREVDVMDLNSQGLVFQHNVLRTGKLIYDADHSFRVKFVASVISRFCDFEPTLRFIERFRLKGLIRRFA
jgi:predicted nucleotidyltransferase